MEGPRLAFYSPDGYGLGHFQRNLNIARGFLGRVPAASVLMLAGLSGVPGAELPAGADLVKVPSIRKVGTDQWDPRSLRMSRTQVMRLRKDIIGAALESYQPDVLLVDYTPAGVDGELLGTLSRLSRDGRTRLVLGLRDVLDAVPVTRRTWQSSGAVHALRLYDRILVYGDRRFLDVSEAYGLTDYTQKQVEHVGYVAGPAPSLDVAIVRRHLGLAEGETTILVTAGGGADAYPLMDVALDGSTLLGRENVRLRMVAGPLMAGELYAMLQKRADRVQVELSRSSEQLSLWMAAADLVVTMAAYNTLVEAIAHRKQILSMPRSGPSFEQATRARIFEQHGLLRTIPAGCSAEAFAQAVREQLTRGGRMALAPDLEGAHRVVDVLLGMLGPGGGARSEMSEAPAAAPLASLGTTA